MALALSKAWFIQLIFSEAFSLQSSFTERFRKQLSNLHLFAPIKLLPGIFRYPINKMKS